jgi:hypothetical protein
MCHSSTVRAVEYSRSTLLSPELFRIRVANPNVPATVKYFRFSQP